MVAGVTASRRILVLFYALLLFAMVYTMRSYSFYELPNRDTGVFSHMGRIVLENKTPYLDSWDHKPPMIYFLNAAVFKMFGTGYRSIAYFEFFWICLTISAFLALANLIFSPKAALLSTLLFAAYAGSPGFTQFYGMPETHMLLPAILALYFILKLKSRGIPELLAGFCVFTAFLFKQPGITAAVPVLILSAFKNGPPAEKNAGGILFFAAGFAVPAAIIMAYFAGRGAAGEFISQVFTYNFMYISDLREPLWHHLDQNFLRARPALAAAALAGIIAVVRRPAAARGSSAAVPHIGAALCIWLALDLFMTLITRRFYNHYFVQLVPCLALLSGFALEKVPGITGKTVTTAATVLIFVFSGMTSGMELSIRQNIKQKTSVTVGNTAYKGNAFYAGVIKWVLDNTAPSDYVYFWGAETGINFVTDRRNPSKYTYIYPLLNCRYVTPEMAERFYSDLSTKRPAYIIDSIFFFSNAPAGASGGTKGFSPHPGMCVPALLAKSACYVIDNYEPAGDVNGWPVYRLKGRPRAFSE